jgi:hypothetical protein
MIKLTPLVAKRGYTAIVLTERFRTLLLQVLADKIPDGWDVIVHHMTIDPFKTDADERLNKQFSLIVTELGVSNNAMAVKVTGYDRKTNNAFPHITIAVNTKCGGKPKDSNEIKTWIPINPIPIVGTIQNVL